ncbi:MAG: PhoH family protein, partial [Lachnospiraceae bacterium]|nr:PhoH family protein [Lachnospiraceae bacterium]
MEEVTISKQIPAEHERNLFGRNDHYIKSIEKEYEVKVIDRDGFVKIIGDKTQAERVSDILDQLVRLSQKGNDIEEQNVNYAITLGQEDRTKEMEQIDKDLICHTVSGKPVKPKTLGQKSYVDSIRKNMITFGIGPAGTGKTYLAMAMAITAFKKEEVGRIILTRPAIEAGEKLGFLPGDLQ